MNLEWCRMWARPALILGPFHFPFLYKKAIMIPFLGRTISGPSSPRLKNNWIDLKHITKHCEISKNWKFDYIEWFQVILLSTWLCQVNVIWGWSYNFFILKSVKQWKFASKKDYHSFHINSQFLKNIRGWNDVAGSDNSWKEVFEKSQAPFEDMWKQARKIRG